MSKKAKYVEKSYRLTDDRTGLSYSIKTGKRKNLLIFDEDKGINRPIRHCPSESTVYADDIGEEVKMADGVRVVKQGDKPKVVPIVFKGGYLTVKSTDQFTQKFLALHPSNVANGGGLFEEVNEEAEAEDALEIQDLKIDIYDAIREKAAEDGGEYALEAIVAVLENSVVTAREMGVKSLKRRIYQEIESDPYFFCDDNDNVNIFEDDYINRKYFVLRAISENIIKKSSNGKSMLWVKGGDTIMSAPRGVELTEGFADFLASDEGILVSEEIKKRS